MVKKKECFICGNSNEDEIVHQLLFSDKDGNEGEFYEWMCDERKGCC